MQAIVSLVYVLYVLARAQAQHHQRSSRLPTRAMKKPAAAKQHALKRPAAAKQHALKRPAATKHPASKRWPANSLIRLLPVMNYSLYFTKEEDKCQVAGCERLHKYRCDYCEKVICRSHLARHQPVKDATWREAGFTQCQACCDDIQAARS